MSSPADPRSDACPACGDIRCKICTEPGCGLRYCVHHPCPVCRSALEHARLHPDGVTTAEEWDGRARMAACRVAAGLPMTDVEAEALRRVPDPTFLCGDCWQYRPRDHACVAACPPERPGDLLTSDRPSPPPAGAQGDLSGGAR